MVKPDVAQEGAGVEMEFAPLVRDFLRNLLDPVIKTWDGNGAVVVVQFAKHLCEHMDRVDGQAAIEARVQISIGGGEDNLQANDPAQRDGDRGRGPVPHPCVTDQSNVGPQLLRVVGEERR